MCAGIGGNANEQCGTLNVHGVRVEAYGGKGAAGIGLSVDEEGSEAAFDWQVSLLGLEVGRAVRLFTEAGVGDQGFFIAGLRVRF